MLLVCRDYRYRIQGTVYSTATVPLYIAVTISRSTVAYGLVRNEISGLQISVQHSACSMNAEGESCTKRLKLYVRRNSTCGEYETCCCIAETPPEKDIDINTHKITASLVDHCGT